MPQSVSYDFHVSQHEMFSLSKFVLSSADVSVLSYYLISPQCNLYTLVLKECHVSFADFCFLCSQLTNNQTLKFLSLLCNQYLDDNSSSPVLALALLFRNHKTLEQLNISLCWYNVNLRSLVESVQGSLHKTLGLEPDIWKEIETLWNLSSQSMNTKPYIFITVNNAILCYVALLTYMYSCTNTSWCVCVCF